MSRLNGEERRAWDAAMKTVREIRELIRGNYDINPATRKSGLAACEHVIGLSSPLIPAPLNTDPEPLFAGWDDDCEIANEVRDKLRDA